MPTVRRFTLRTRIALLVFASTGLALLCSSALLFLQLRQSHNYTLLERMRFAGTAYSQRIENVLKGGERDAETMALLLNSLGITDLILEGQNTQEGLPVDGQRRRDATAQIFLEFMAKHEHYTQLRLLSKDGNWQERVRVNREGSDLVIVPVEELQQKGSEPYVQPMNDGTSAQVYFSDLTRNREHGQTVGEPTIRVVAPLRELDGEIIGAIIINANAATLLASADLTVTPGFQVYAISDNLDYMAFGTGEDAPRFVFHQDTRWHAPPFANQLKQAEDQTFFDPQTGSLVYWSSALEQGDNIPFDISILAIADSNTVIVPGLTRLQGIAVISACLAVLSALGTYLLAAKFLSPLTRLNEEIQTRIDSFEPVTFETRHNDEVSDLANSFSQVVNTRIAEAARLDAIVKSAADGIIAIESDGTISEVNPAAEKLFGYTSDELVGKSVTILMPDREGLSHGEYVNRSLLSDTPKVMGRNRDIFGVCKDGRQIPLSISVTRAFYGNRVHFIGMIRDVSERKAAEAEVNELIAALQRSNEELDQFAYVASHDLKAPLRVINNAATWLAEDLAPHLTEDTQESLDLLRNRATRMERLLDDLLRHSRIGRDDGPAVIISGRDLREELEELLDLPDGIQVHFGKPFDDLELRRLPLQIILLNLISNAIRHHDKPTGEVWVDAEDRPQEIVFRVKDNGPGIPAEYHDKIFEIFQTLRPRDEIESSGMGLALVKKHATLANAKILVESDGTDGSTFTLHWPKQTAPQELVG